MKKQVLLIALSLLTTVAFSQNLSYGVRVGLNVSNVFGEPYNSTTGTSKTSKSGFNLGVYALHQLNYKIALQAELFYSQEGFNYRNAQNDIDWGIATETDESKYSFLSLPLFFKYNIAKNFYVMGGPQFCYLLSADRKYSFEKGLNGKYGIDAATYDDSANMNKFSIALTPVLGYDLNKISFSARYCIGLSSLGKTQYNMNLRSEVFSIVVSYRILASKQ